MKTVDADTILCGNLIKKQPFSASLAIINGANHYSFITTHINPV